MANLEPRVNNNVYLNTIKGKDQLMDELNLLRKKIVDLERENRLFNETEKKLRATNQQLDASNRLLQAREQQLKSQQETLMRTQSIAHVGSWDWDIATDVVRWSNELFQIFRMNPENGAVSYADHPKIYTQKSMHHLDLAVKHALETGEPYAVDLEIIRGDGTNAFCTARGFTKKDNKGEIIQLFGTLQDITERKKSEEQLKALNQQIEANDLQLKTSHEALVASEKQFRQLFENMEQGFALHEMIYNQEGNPIDYRFILSNNAFDKLTGIDASAYIGKTVKQVLPDTEQIWIDNYGKVALTGKSMQFEHYSQEFDKYYNVTAYSPKRNFFATVFTDTTQEKLQSKQLREAKEKAEESEEKFRQMFQFSPDSIIIHDMEMNIIDFNNKALEEFGYQKEEFINKTVFELHSPDELPNSKRILKKMNKQDMVKVETKFVKKDGSTFPAEAIPCKYTLRGKPIIHVVIRNIAEQKKAETDLILAKEKAEEGEIKFKAAFYTSPDSININKMDGEYIDINEGFTRVTGYTKDDVIGKLSSEIDIWTIPKDREKLSLSLEKFGFIENLESIFKSKDGTLIPALMSAKIITLENEPHILSVTRAITERKKIEQELIAAKEKAEESEIKFKLLNHLTSEMLRLQDMESIYKFIAENLQKHYPNTLVLIVSIDEAIQQSRLEFISGMNNSLLTKIIKILGINPIGKIYKLTDIHNHYFKSGNFVEFDGGLVKFSNSEIPAFAVGAIEKLIGLHKIYTIGINKDTELLAAIHFLTFNKQEIIDDNFIKVFVNQAGLVLQKKINEKALKKAKEKAEESDRLKSAFLANMSHEIRTPMNGILGFTDLLKTPKLTGDEKDQYIRIIESSGNRLLNTVNDLIDFSKIEAGQMNVSISKVNINELLGQLYTFFNVESQKKGLQLLLNTTSSTKDIILHSDKEKIYSILTNLIKNAIKYTQKGSIEFGYILKKNTKPTEMEFFVKDTGNGIPIENLEVIFDRFVRVGNDEKVFNEGAGLGLSITKAYVDMLGGKIWVESEEGVGSQFYFTIPLETEKIIIDEYEEVRSGEKAKAHINPEISGLKILIVEDDEAADELLSILVNDIGKKIIHTKSGRKAVDLCCANPDLDLILMDINMPEMNGYEATRQIREFNKEVIIIAQTAYALAGDNEKSIEAGCNAYISKPIIKDELMSLIQQFVIK